MINEVKKIQNQRGGSNKCWQCKYCKFEYNKNLFTTCYNCKNDKNINMFHQSGGSLNKLNINTSPFQKTTINNLKKLPLLYNYVNETIRKRIDEFDFSYVHIVGSIFNFEIIGVHLIKNKKENVMYEHTIICSVLNNNNSLDLLTKYYHEKGKQLVFKIDMTMIQSENHQELLDSILIYNKN